MDRKVDAVEILLAIFVLLHLIAVFVSQEFWPDSERLYSLLSNNLNSFTIALFTALGVGRVNGYRVQREEKKQAQIDVTSHAG